MRVDKDYYQALEVGSKASADAIRKAYRRLALKYHPDKEKDNPLALERFYEIRDAWEILGNDRLRRRYDDARWIAGLASRKQPDIISAEWLLLQCRQLEEHIGNLDTHRMEQGRLTAYLLLLLSDHHQHLLQGEENPETINQVTGIVSVIAFRLRREFFERIMGRLRVLHHENPENTAELNKLGKSYRKKEVWLRWRPVLALVAALLLCLVMLWWSGRK